MLALPARPLPESVLIISLVSITPNELQRFLSYFSVTPSERLIVINAPNDDCGKRPDRVSRVYRLSALACHQGWDFVIFIDSLTQSQLSGHVRPGRSKEPSIVLSSIHRSKKADDKTGALVAARRLDLQDLNVLTLMLYLPLLVSREQGYTLAQSYFNRGLILADPDRQIYDRCMPTERQMLAKDAAESEVVDRVQALPFELRDMISRYHKDGTLTKNMTSAPSRILQTLVVNIQVVIPMSRAQMTDIVQQLRNLTRKTCRGWEFVLHRWEHPVPATRQQIWHLFERWFVLNRLEIPFLFIEEFPLVPAAPLSMIRWDFYRCPMVSRVGVRTACDFWDSKFREFERKRDGTTATGKATGNLAEKYTELLIDYDGPFYHDPPAFIPGVDEGKHVPIFVITPEAKEITLVEMEAKMNPRYGAISPLFVPWDQVGEGTVHDMWRKTWATYSYRTEMSPQCALFLDRQSLQDGTLVLTQLM